jgi:hypothetical protein
MKRGEAYAIFGCNASKKQIEAELPKSRYDVRLPDHMTTSLEDLTEQDILPNTDLKAAIKREESVQTAREIIKELSPGMRVYGMHALSNNQTSKETARLLSDLLNNLYMGTKLYQYGEPYCASVTFKDEDGKYKTFE